MMQFNTNEVEELRVSIEECRDAISKMEALERLQDNRDFVSVVGKGYFQDEAVRLVNAKSERALQDDKYQKLILRDIDAIGALRQYFHTVMQTGMVAVQALKDNEQCLTELEAEQLEV